jgi:hypothetical protein
VIGFRRIAGGLAAALLLCSWLLVSCGSDRPLRTDWAQQWNGLRDDAAAVLDAANGADPLPATSCRAMDRIGRDARARLIPTPLAELDDPAETWVATAEAIGADCGSDLDLDQFRRDLQDAADDLDGVLAETEPTR